MCDRLKCHQEAGNYMFSCKYNRWLLIAFCPFLSFDVTYSTLWWRLKCVSRFVSPLVGNKIIHKWSRWLFHYRCGLFSLISFVGEKLIDVSFFNFHFPLCSYKICHTIILLIAYFIAWCTGAFILTCIEAHTGLHLAVCEFSKLENVL